MKGDALEVEDPVIVWCTVPDADTARTVAESLVREGLAACVHQMAPGHSTYVWEGKLEREPEILLMIKSRRGACDRLQARLLALHPYQVPEILVTPVTAGLPAYLAWLAGAVPLSDPTPG